MSASTSALFGLKDRPTIQAIPGSHPVLATGGSQIPSQLFEQAHTDQTQPVAHCDRTTFKCVKPWAPVQGHSFIRYMRLQSVTQDSLISALGIIGYEDGKIALTVSVNESLKEKFESSCHLHTVEASLQDGVYVYAVHKESEIENILKHCDFPLVQGAFFKRLINTQNWKTVGLKKKIPCTDVIHRLRRLHLFCGNLEEAENYLNKRSEGYVFFPSSENRKICGLIKWQGSPLIDLQYKIKSGGALKGRWHHEKTSIIESDAHRTIHDMLRIFRNRIAENNARQTKPLSN